MLPSPKVRNLNTRLFVPFHPFPFQQQLFSKTLFPYTTKLYNKSEHDLLRVNKKKLGGGGCQFKGKKTGNLNKSKIKKNCVINWFGFLFGEIW